MINPKPTIPSFLRFRHPRQDPFWSLVKPKLVKATQNAKKTKEALSYDHYMGIAKKSAVEYLMCNGVEAEGD